MATVSKIANLDPTKPRAVTDYRVAYPIQGLLLRFDENLVPWMDLPSRSDSVPAHQERQSRDPRGGGG